MSAYPSPVVSVTLLQVPIVDPQTGMVSPQWQRWFLNMQQAVNNGLTLQGTALKLGFPAIGVLGGVQATIPAASQWVSGIGPDGAPTLSQPQFSDIGGSLVTSGSGAPSSTPADGNFYFDTSASPAHGYVRLAGAWVQFS